MSDAKELTGFRRPPSGDGKTGNTPTTTRNSSNGNHVGDDDGSSNSPIGQGAGGGRGETRHANPNTNSDNIRGESNAGPSGSPQWSSSPGGVAPQQQGRRTSDDSYTSGTLPPIAVHHQHQHSSPKLPHSGGRQTRVPVSPASATTAASSPLWGGGDDDKDEDIGNGGNVSDVKKRIGSSNNGVGGTDSNNNNNNNTTITTANSGSSGGSNGERGGSGSGSGSRGFARDFDDDLSGSSSGMGDPPSALRRGRARADTTAYSPTAPPLLPISVPSSSLSPSSAPPPPKPSANTNTTTTTSASNNNNNNDTAAGSSDCSVVSPLLPPSMRLPTDDTDGADRQAASGGGGKPPASSLPVPLPVPSLLSPNALTTGIVNSSNSSNNNINSNNNNNSSNVSSPRGSATTPYGATSPAKGPRSNSDTSGHSSSPLLHHSHNNNNNNNNYNTAEGEGDDDDNAGGFNVDEALAAAGSHLNKARKHVTVQSSPTKMYSAENSTTTNNTSGTSGLVGWGHPDANNTSDNRSSNSSGNNTNSNKRVGSSHTDRSDGESGSQSGSATANNNNSTTGKSSGSKTGKVLKSLRGGAMPEYRRTLPRVGHTGLVYDRDLYVFGGINAKGQYPNKLFRHLKRSLQWEEVRTLGPVPGGRANHTAVLDGSRMIVYGGHHDLEAYDDMYAYNMSNSRWERIYYERAHGPGPLFLHAAVLVPELHRMLVFGGFHQREHNLYVGHSFDLKNRVWSGLTCPPTVDPQHIQLVTACYVAARAAVVILGLAEADAPRRRTMPPPTVFLLNVHSHVWSRVETTRSPESPIPFRLDVAWEELVRQLTSMGGVYEEYHQLWLFPVMMNEIVSQGNDGGGASSSSGSAKRAARGKKQYGFLRLSTEDMSWALVAASFPAKMLKEIAQRNRERANRSVRLKKTSDTATQLRRSLLLSSLRAGSANKAAPGAALASFTLGSITLGDDVFASLEASLNGGGSETGGAQRSSSLASGPLAAALAAATAAGGGNNNNNNNASGMDGRPGGSKRHLPAAPNNPNVTHNNNNNNNNSNNNNALVLDAKPVQEMVFTVRGEPQLQHKYVYGVYRDQPASGGGDGRGESGSLKPPHYIIMHGGLAPGENYAMLSFTPVMGRVDAFAERSLRPDESLASADDGALMPWLADAGEYDDAADETDGAMGGGANGSLTGGSGGREHRHTVTVHTAGINNSGDRYDDDNFSDSAPELTAADRADCLLPMLPCERTARNRNRFAMMLHPSNGVTANLNGGNNNNNGNNTGGGPPFSSSAATGASGGAQQQQQQQQQAESIVMLSAGARLPVIVMEDPDEINRWSQRYYKDQRRWVAEHLKAAIKEDKQIKRRGGGAGKGIAGRMNAATAGFFGGVEGTAEEDASGMPNGNNSNNTNSGSGNTNSSNAKSGSGGGGRGAGGKKSKKKGKSSSGGGGAAATAADGDNTFNNNNNNGNNNNNDADDDDEDEEDYAAAAPGNRSAAGGGGGGGVGPLRRVPLTITPLESGGNSNNSRPFGAAAASASSGRLSVSLQRQQRGNNNNNNDSNSNNAPRRSTVLTASQVAFAQAGGDALGMSDSALAAAGGVGAGGGVAPFPDPAAERAQSDFFESKRLEIFDMETLALVVQEEPHDAEGRSRSMLLNNNGSDTASNSASGAGMPGGAPPPGLERLWMKVRRHNETQRLPPAVFMGRGAGGGGALGAGDLGIAMAYVMMRNAIGNLRQDGSAQFRSRRARLRWRFLRVLVLTGEAAFIVYRAAQEETKTLGVPVGAVPGLILSPELHLVGPTRPYKVPSRPVPYALPHPPRQAARNAELTEGGMVLYQNMRHVK